MVSCCWTVKAGNQVQLGLNMQLMNNKVAILAGIHPVILDQHVEPSHCGWFESTAEVFGFEEPLVMTLPVLMVAWWSVDALNSVFFWSWKVAILVIQNWADWYPQMCICFHPWSTDQTPLFCPDEEPFHSHSIAGLCERPKYPRPSTWTAKWGVKRYPDGTPGNQLKWISPYETCLISKYWSKMIYKSNLAFFGNVILAGLGFTYRFRGRISGT